MIDGELRLVELVEGRREVSDSSDIIVSSIREDVESELHDVVFLDVKDEKNRFRIPRDLCDIPMLKEQQPVDGVRPIVRLTVLSERIRAILLARNIRCISKDEGFYLLADGEDFSNSLRDFGKDFNVEVGMAILGGNAIPYCEYEGEKYRILSVPDKFDDRELEEEVSKVFVPSRVIASADNRYLLMPILENIEHIDEISLNERDDFLGRLRASRLAPHLDLGMNINSETGRQHPESNMVRYNNKLYLSDAGDILHGDLDVQDKSDVFDFAASELEKRVKVL